MSAHILDNWEAVIGLEIHVQLNTKSKLFSPAPNRFGDEPNTNISYVCTGQPGTLPVLNKEAVRKAVQFACAVDANVALYSEFDRKSYFYPDSPRNFQITQFHHPIMEGGQVEVELVSGHKTFQINRAHIEDDAGMLKHFSSFAGVDYNRAGVPLLEIVSEPCMHTAKEAVAYAMAIRAIMLYIDASDCNMEEGSLRIDANISVRPKGEKNLRPKVEIKNMNSFSKMELAIDAEIARQVKLYTENPTTDASDLIQSATYRFDLERKKMVMMREKEEAKDYRYFPEPDLPPLILTEEYVEEIRKRLPELPRARTERYVHNLGLSEYAASVLINDKFLCDYFEEALKNCQNPKALCNWVSVEFVGRFKDRALTLPKSGILPLHIAELVNLIESGVITGKIAKSVADIMVEKPGKSPSEIVKENPDFQPVQDQRAIEAIVEEVLQENAQSVLDYKNGKGRAFDFLVGQVMKKTRGKASPDIVNAILNKKLGL